ncbi:hypothetical protein HBZC1_p0260 (plasmid) [Helicobacter bizzozeronii CIII-1]|uniref:Uncharacterized protein n=1 Tax=Helicobacter bizzozeronii (strain CIII-1) TaxID=1002804 RepID=F8KUH1_HELBC|nr:hypothetical protein HBZC1_p0260 [Helicobacter bizzozeronii CIII-1]
MSLSNVKQYKIYQNTNDRLKNRALGRVDFCPKKRRGAYAPL